MREDQVPPAERISVARFEDLREDDQFVRILDVRTGGEFETAHIPGSYNVPLDTLVEHLAEFAHLEHPTVLVCQSGGRATQAGNRLEKTGKRGLYILDGGLNAWLAADREVLRSDRHRWPLDRQVRLMAGSVSIIAVILSLFVAWTIWLAGLVGVGLVYMAVTDTCPISPLMAKLPFNRADPCDVTGVLAAMQGT
jgi:rhodanese-related sulfurtransferase